jgi:hypothetical protein
MLTKKEKLLIHPWITQRYHQHRRKVQSAGPAIDFYPPNNYPHITAKLKKLQKEFERQQQVKKDNIRLLQRLGSIMTTKRLKNFWEAPRPSFLNREFIYPVKTVTKTETAVNKPAEAVESPETPRKISSGKCTVCSGKFIKPNKVIPEERVPWKPAQPTRNVKFLQNANAPVHKCCKYCC